MQLSSRTVQLTHRGRPLDFEVLADDAIIGPAIGRGSWADDETALMRAHLRPGCRVLDLGANVGWFAVQAVLAGAEVHAFEPVPAIAELCRRNLERAMQVGPGRGQVHPFAAGAIRGEARIALGAENRGDNRVVEEGAGAPEDMAGPELSTIQVVPVDEVLEGPIRFLKVDTQGSEWLALQGARRVLEASPALGLLMEFWPYALREASAEGLLEFLGESGFTLGKATDAPFPMSRERILRQMRGRDPVRGGIDLYGTRGLPFHVLGWRARLKGWVRSVKES